MSVIAFFIAAAEIAIAAIILWHVCNFIGMPAPPKYAVQFLIAFVAIMAVLQMIVSDSVPGLARRSFDPLLSTPSIVAPERR
jgi:hypothetical protein